jgi:hypothetical protein
MNPNMQSTRHDLQTLAARVLKDAAPEEAVVLAWPLVCGSAVAERAAAVCFESGTLRVRVPDRGWQSQLEAFSRHYMDKLSRISGVVVSRIEYEIASVSPHPQNR